MQEQRRIKLPEIVDFIAASARKHHHIVMSVEMTGQKNRSTSTPVSNRRDSVHRLDIVGLKVFGFIRYEAPQLFRLYGAK
jgi:hypothetical protein